MILFLKGGMGYLLLIDVDKSILYIKIFLLVKNFFDFIIFD